MSAPVVLSVIPAVDAQDIVLGAPIQVTFDQPIDPTTVTDATFILEGPGQVLIVEPEQLIVSSARREQTGREYILGAFIFSAGNSVVKFTPGKPFQPNAKYQVRIIGSGGLLTSSGVKNPGGEQMAASYGWCFYTGNLLLTKPPVSSPLPYLRASFDPVVDVKVNPRLLTVNNNLSQSFEFVFPADIDPNSFDPKDLLVSIEPMLGDLSVVIPDGLESTVEVNQNKITVTVTGWPAGS